MFVSQAGQVSELVVSRDFRLCNSHGSSCIGSKFHFSFLSFFANSGDRCELNIDNCASLPCLNNGECIDLVDDYQCNCQTGYIGKNCQHEVDVCNQLGPDGEKLEICQNGGQCLAQQGYIQQKKMKKQNVKLY